MSEPAKSVYLHLGDYEQQGLYLILKDSTRVVLTYENIEKVTAEFWRDENRIPSHLKEAIEFQRCFFCPMKGKEDFCDALRPVLPFLDVVDRYVSFDEVVAIYKGDQKGLLFVADTTMQEALKSISILSMTRYCQVGRKYHKYYSGIVPLMSGEKIAVRLYLNIYWQHRGKKKAIDKLISEFEEDLTRMSENQVKRLNLICKNDAFLNAFVNAQISVQRLSMDIDKLLESTFAKFDKGAELVGKK